MIKSSIKIGLKHVDMRSPWPVLYPIAMTRRERLLLKMSIRSSSCHLEFGAGGSTIYALQHSRARIISVDSDIHWIDFLKRYSSVRRAVRKDRIQFHHIDIGSTGAWGYPSNLESRNSFPEYSAKVFNERDCDLVDTIFIDGRFRLACILRTTMQYYKRRDVRILVHDFWNRKTYHDALNFLDEENAADSLGVFRIKETIDEARLHASYEHHKYVPS